MAKLSKAERKALPAETFAGPGRSYPVPDKGHAHAAIVDAAHAEHVGHISKATEAHIDARARAVLGNKASTIPHRARAAEKDWRDD
jgi:hypothetical protein